MEKLGTIGITTATLFNKDNKKIATCIDTPNGIAKALEECKEAQYVKESFNKEIFPRSKYEGRINKWNKAISYLKVL